MNEWKAFKRSNENRKKFGSKYTTVLIRSISGAVRVWLILTFFCYLSELIPSSSLLKEPYFVQAPPLLHVIMFHSTTRGCLIFLYVIGLGINMWYSSQLASHEQKAVEKAIWEGFIS